MTREMTPETAREMTPETTREPTPEPTMRRAWIADTRRKRAR
jgi:hypothetical protein